MTSADHVLVCVCVCASVVSCLSKQFPSNVLLRNCNSMRAWCHASFSVINALFSKMLLFHWHVQGQMSFSFVTCFVLFCFVISSLCILLMLIHTRLPGWQFTYVYNMLICVWVHCFSIGFVICVSDVEHLAHFFWIDLALYSYAWGLLSCVAIQLGLRVPRR